MAFYVFHLDVDVTITWEQVKRTLFVLEILLTITATLYWLHQTYTIVKVTLVGGTTLDTGSQIVFFLVCCAWIIFGFRRQIRESELYYRC